MITRTRLGPWGVDQTAARLADIHQADIAEQVGRRIHAVRLAARHSKSEGERK